MKTLTKDFAVSAKDGGGGDAGEWTFEGYASTFDREPDCYGDVVARGAFGRTLRERAEAGRPVPLLFGHNMDDPDYSLGYVECSEDERGLRVTGHIFSDTPKGPTVHNMLKRGLVDRMSFAYAVADQCEVELEDGTKANELRDLDLFECSVVTVPANAHATVDEVKAAKFGRRNSKADEEDLGRIADLAGQIGDIAASLMGGGVGEGADEGGEPGGKGAATGEGREDAFLDIYKQAIIDTL